MRDDQPIIITIDGPAGTGKSTVSRRLATELGLDFLDTGAMYRAAAAIMIDKGIGRDAVDDLVATVYDADLHFDWHKDPPAILAWDEPIEHRIRDEDVTDLVSFVATVPQLREHMVRKQRVIWGQHPRLVSEGRDQGSVAFPDAPVKFYLDAEPLIRARRRMDQLGIDASTMSVQEMCQRIIERDRIDSTRSDGPLLCPDDAIRVDTSDLDIDGVVGELARRARERLEALARKSS